MGIVKEIIVIEDRFKEVISFIPGIEVGGDTFPVTFGYGDPKELNAFLKSKENDEFHPYPLIWLLYPVTEEHRKTEVILNNAQFIIAVDTNSSILNEERLTTSYKEVLFLIYNNFILAMSKSNTINLKRDVKVTKFPNYSGDEKTSMHFTTDGWDALKVIINCRINNVCLKTIKL